MGVSPKRQNYFTKHLFRAGLQCPTKLYYYAHHYPQDQSIRPFLEHAGRNKYQLKGVLRGCHPGGTQIDEPDYESAFERTRALLNGTDKTLYDAVFISRHKVARVPVLVADDQSLALHFIETKVIKPAKHKLENHHGMLYKKWSQYIYDAAFHCSIVQDLYPERMIKTFLSLPDKSANAGQDAIYNHFSQRKPVIQNENILHTIDISRFVYELLGGQRKLPDQQGQSFQEALEWLVNRFFDENKWPAEVGLKCKNCEFRTYSINKKMKSKSGFVECWNQAENVTEDVETEPHVFDLIGPGIKNWVEQGLYFQKNLPSGDLPDTDQMMASSRAITQKERQALQVLKTKGEAVPNEIIKPVIFDEIKRWQYPLHFLDFEAGNYAVPIRKNRRPYHLVVFQFSCHTLYKNGDLTHHDWISMNGNPYPNYAMVSELMKVPDIEQGTLIQYSNFERTALKIILKELQNETESISESDDLIMWLRNIIRRNDSNHKSGPYLADLSRLVKKYYYNKYMADSLSIKDVVQSVLTQSTKLKAEYKQPYHGSNFEGIQWYQSDGEEKQVQNPYELLRTMQPGLKVGRGTEAMVAYGKILEGVLTGSSKKEALYALLQYCELDTLAMVMIYRHWQNLAETG